MAVAVVARSGGAAPQSNFPLHDDVTFARLGPSCGRGHPSSSCQKEQSYDWLKHQAKVTSSCSGKFDCGAAPPDLATTATAMPRRALRWHLHASLEESGCPLPAENVSLQTGRHILVEPRNLRSASTHHNHVRIKKIDDLRQTAREPVFESIERGERGRFACSASRDDFGALEEKRPLHGL